MARWRKGKDGSVRAPRRPSFIIGLYGGLCAYEIFWYVTGANRDRTTLVVAALYWLIAFVVWWSWKRRTAKFHAAVASVLTPAQRQKINAIASGLIESAQMREVSQQQRSNDFTLMKETFTYLIAAKQPTQAVEFIAEALDCTSTRKVHKVVRRYHPEILRDTNANFNPKEGSDGSPERGTSTLD